MFQFLAVSPSAELPLFSAGDAPVLSLRGGPTESTSIGALPADWLVGFDLGRCEVMQPKASKSGQTITRSVCGLV